MLNSIQSLTLYKIANRILSDNREKNNFCTFFSAKLFRIVSSLNIKKRMKDVLGKIDLVKANAIFLFLLCLFILVLIKKRVFNKYAPVYLRLIPLYILLIIFQLAFGNYIIFITKSYASRKYLVNLSAYIFTILEYFIFAILLSKFIKLTIIKRSVRCSCILFALVAVIVWNTIPSSTNALSFITGAESISLIPFCLYYFYELLNVPPFLKITEEPAFWITTGILFLLICITPYYLAFDYFRKMSEMQMIDFFGYDLLVLFLAKASFTKSKLENG
jgi:hypothetical protein